MRPKVVITHWVHPEVIALLAEHCDVVPNTSCDTLAPAEVRRRAAEADGLMTFMPDSVDEAFLRACPRLRVIGCALKGYDNYDVEACNRHGVWLTIVPDLLTIPTAELAVGLTIALARHVLDGDREVRSGRFCGWLPQLYGTGLAGRTAGIIGLGAVGRATARRLRTFDMRVCYTDPDAERPTSTEDGLFEPLALPELLRVSDYVLPLVPLRADTFHLICAETLALMKPGAFLINVCRGSVVDEAAVAVALASGRLGGYAADVFEFEDWARPDRPRAVPLALLEQSRRTLFTPHLGSAVSDVRRQIEFEAARSILQGLAGQTPQGAMNHPRRRVSA